MKNSFLKLLLILVIVFFGFTKILSDELKFEGSVIELLKNGNEIKGSGGIKITTKDNIKITADRFNYNKLKLILIAKGNVKVLTEDNLEILADKIEHNEKQSILIAAGNAKITDPTSGIQIQSDKFTYNKMSEIILSNKKTIAKDKYENYFELEGFEYFVLKKNIKTKKVMILDNKKNRYDINFAMINLITDEVIGKDLKIDFINDLFNNDENQPRLKGNYLYLTKDKSIIKNAVFTNCKKREKCPPWTLKAKEITHDRNKKMIFYKNAWLNLYDKPVLYFPKFFHPDPTVKRQSGFLIPKISNTTSLGSALILPYYYVVAGNRDATFTPNLYSNGNFMLQTEYREVKKNRKNIADLSFKDDSINNKSYSHIFYNSISSLDINKLDVSGIEFNIETTSSNDYLKTHKMKSPLINNTSTLNSYLNFSGYTDDLTMEVDFDIYENLTKNKNSDKFEYISSYQFSKFLKNNIEFNLSGFQKQFDTNVSETILVNDASYTSNLRLSKTGFETNYELFFKNVLTNTNNSTSHKDYEDARLYSTLKYNSSYPLINKGSKYDNYITPKLSFMFSPTKTRDLSDRDERLAIDNIYSANRTGSNDTLEGGESLTVGSEYKFLNKNDSELLRLNLATVLRNNRNLDLPKTSKLGEKYSDIVGELNIEPNDNINFNYDFSLDKSLNRANYNFVDASFNVNNFVTTFEFLEENNEIGSESYIGNKTKYSLNDSQILSFSTRKNRKTDLTEFYNLLYQYQNDCLIASIEYNKDYYSDGELQPNEEIYFSFTITPFATIKSPSIGK